MMKARRFVNVVTDGYLLSRIKLKNNLFYPSAAEARQQAAAKNENEAVTAPATADHVLRLPPSKLVIKPSAHPSNTSLNFTPFYGGAGGEGNVLCIDESGHAALYDAAGSTVEMMPSLNGPKGFYPISFSAAQGSDDPARPDAIYVLERVASSRRACRFEALVYGDPNPPRPYSGKEGYAWHWRPLPPPPVSLGKSISQCHALLHGQDGGGGTCYVSYFICSGPDGPYRRLDTATGNDLEDTGTGTYRFDTATSEWTKAGDWMLPFFYKALHVPELGDDLLFGIESHPPYRFCAMDASGLQMNKPPALRHAWMDIIVDPLQEWRPSMNSVAYLGDGKFCIHRSFDIMEAFGMEWESVDTVVLLTGVEVVRAGSRLRLIKHKSKRLDCNIHYVL